MVFKSSDIIELLSAEREHFLKSLQILLKEMKEFLTETHEYPEASEISPICWETKGLKNFQNEVLFISRSPYIFFVLPDW